MGSEIIIILLFFSMLLISCVFLSNFSVKIGIPFLLIFIIFGVFLANNPLPGPHMVVDHSSYGPIGDVCTAALIIIMFYGGFGTSWKASKSVAVEAGLLATVGVLLTAAFTTLCCRLLGMPWHVGFLIGAVTSSTDAASVFSILRSRNLGLKNGLAPLLEIESGANDPCSNILTLIAIPIFLVCAGAGGTETVTAGGVSLMFVQQLGLGALCGLAIAALAVLIFKKVKVESAGYNSLLMLSFALLSYAVPSAIGGNGYLSSYLVGIILGNCEYVTGKKELVHFFDGISGLMQVLIFCSLGFLAKTGELVENLVPAILIFLGITLVARPLAVSLVLVPFRKYTFKQILFVSLAGLRGAASIVFAIVAITGITAAQNNDISEATQNFYSIIFVMVLLSIGLQGSLLPYLAKKLDLIDPNADVLKTFTDFSDDSDLQFNDVDINEGDKWEGKTIAELGIPQNVLICGIIRKDGTKIIPTGRTVLKAGDKMILFSKSFQSDGKFAVFTDTITEGSPYLGKAIREYKEDGQVLLIKRKVDKREENIIPNGSTVLLAGDKVYLHRLLQQESKA